MVKQCSEYQRKCYEEMRQQIVDYFCPDKSVLVVESVLAQIRMKAATMPMPMHVHEQFKCRNCGHDEAWVMPTHDTCKKCAVVKDKIHQGKAYRDIKDREGDLNGIGMPKDAMMSQGYNMSTMPKQHSDPNKKVSNSKVKKLANMNREDVTTKDKHIIEARMEIENISAKLHFNSPRKGAIELFARYLNSVGRLTNKNVVLAACMFHTLRKPSGKVWVKRFSKGTYSTSKQRRLKFIDFKKPFKKPFKKSKKYK